MAKSLWGKIYLYSSAHGRDLYVGRLAEEPGGRMVFTYDESYIAARHPAIAHTLPIREAPYLCERGLHPFFDNLAAEGWLCNAQAKALGVHPNHRLALLLGFGYDLVGAVSIIDPEPQAHVALDHTDEATLAALTSRASLSGVQRKLAVVKEGNSYRPSRRDELSTHIAKLSSGNLAHLIELEYLTTQAVRALLPNDRIVTMEIVTLPAIRETALVIPRFDRTSAGNRVHFEEFNQLLGRYSGDDKYDAAYEDMGKFIVNTPGCMRAEADHLLQRIFACLLVGNTDAHLKNFAMFHTTDGLRLTPAYDLVASSMYKEYQTIALAIGPTRNLEWAKLRPQHLRRMSGAFAVNDDALVAMIEDMGRRLPIALDAISDSDVGSKSLRDRLQQRMEKRWNGSFASIGRFLSKKRGSAGSAKG